MFSEEAKKSYIKGHKAKKYLELAAEKLVRPASKTKLSDKQMAKDITLLATMPKDENIIRLTSLDFVLQREIQEQKFKRLRDEPENISNNDLNTWDKHAMTRYALFRSDVTDENGQIKNDVEEMSTEELLKLMKE